MLQCLRDEGITFVDKKDNPSNVPEAQCIEDFWALLESMVYAKNWRAENVDQLSRRIRYCIKKIDVSIVQKLAMSTKDRIDRIRLNGVIESH